MPDRLGTAWVFRGTRMPVSAVFDNLAAGATIDEIMEQFDVTREQINAVPEFAARSLDAPVSASAPRRPGIVGARSLWPCDAKRGSASSFRPPVIRRRTGDGIRSATALY